MVAAPNHTGKLPFIDVQDVAAHTKIAPHPRNIGGLIAGNGTIISTTRFFSKYPRMKGFQR